jgi:hypothetical protein
MSKYIIDFLQYPNSKTFKRFTINYSKRQKECLKNFIISEEGTFEHFGPLDLTGLKNFLATIGNNSNDCINTIHNLIIQLTKNVCTAYGKDAVWISLRVSLPNDLFDIPRWHCDGEFYGSVNKNERQSKFIISLIGPGTLLSNPPKEVRDKFFLIRDMRPVNEEKYQENRMARYNLLKNEKQVKLNNSQAVIFFVGNTETCAIHSEPPIREPRMFLSILPGYKSEIEELKQRWKR